MSEEMEITYLPVAQLFADPDFNCRGTIAPIDVADLAIDIEKHGLQQPIVVRPGGPDGYTHTVVAGHRRHMAFQVNNTEQIPTVVKELDDFTARTLNLNENLKRKDLNIMQEAKALEPYRTAQWSREMVAREFGMSPGWVQVRFMILDLKPDIQEAIAALELTQTQIRDLYSMRKNHAAQCEAIRRVKDARAVGDPSIKGKSIKKPSAKTKRNRTKAEIEAFMAIVAQVCDGPIFASRCLAWAAGNITDLDVHTSLKEYADDEGFNYSIPEFAETE